MIAPAVEFHGELFNFISRMWTGLFPGLVSDVLHWS